MAPTASLRRRRLRPRAAAAAAAALAAVLLLCTTTASALDLSAIHRGGPTVPGERDWGGAAWPGARDAAGSFSNAAGCRYAVSDEYPPWAHRRRLAE